MAITTEGVTYLGDILDVLRLHYIQDAPGHTNGGLWYWVTESPRHRAWQAAGRDRVGWWVGCPGVITDEAERVRSYVAGLSRVRAAAGALFFDTEDRVLLVKPVYKPDWEIPGGVIEKDESPRDACLREVTEELGVALRVGPLLVVDWVPAGGAWDAGLMFVFDGGVLPVDPADIHLATGELERFAFVPTEDLGTYLVPRMTQRGHETTRYLISFDGGVMTFPEEDLPDMARAGHTAHGGPGGQEHWRVGVRWRGWPLPQP